MAEKYELGQGYVQIIPSAKGIEGKISAMLDPEAEKAGESAGKKVTTGMSGQLQSGAKKIGREIGIALAAVATATGKLIKDALDQYGEYEQLTGGVAKLFGDNADAVMKNASDAFKNAQMSANEYMQTVTSFSASLIQSLGGDTEKAVGYADTAINDMADNANTFGTSMESIQNAYQGFAKQNYTMLDNLKLGYGGTKEEMVRLVEDAEQLNSTFKASRDENGKLTLSFADIVDAIHIVQDNMGITGTTAKEAASTVQGSINTLKASWKNFLTGLGDPNADVKALTKNVVDSAKQVIKNVMPIIKNVLKEIPNALGEVWDSLGKGQSIISTIGVSIGGLKIGSMIADLGLISPAMGLAIGASVAFCAAMVQLKIDMYNAKLEADEMWQREQVLTEKTNELTDSVKANSEAYAQASAARLEAYNANTAEIENVQGLWGELKTLLSTNDELSESERARAEFILGQVNKALGSEYELTDLLTGQKDELVSAIDREIQARKDSIALQILEEGYTAAVQDRGAAEEKLNEIYAQRETVTKEAEVADAEYQAMHQQYLQNRELMSNQEWATEYGILQQRKLAYDQQVIDLNNSYNEQLQTVANYAADKALYEDAMQAHAQGMFDAEKFMSSETKDAYIANAMASADGVAAENYRAEQSVLNSLATQLSILTGKKWEFYDGGDGNIMSYVDGVAAGTSLSVDEIKNMISQMTAKMSDASGDFEVSTGYIMSAIKNTIDNRAASVVSSVSGLASSMNRAFNAVNMTASPSKLYIKSTEWITKGIEKGISEGEDDVVASMKNLAVDMNDAYNSVVGSDATFSASKSINSFTNETATFTGSITTAESASSKLDAIYAVLSTYFPQMLEASEKEVVLDGGKLVGSLAPKINTELGKLNTRNSRGGVCTA